jgi:IclR family pca regulon transcriptional regulator
MRNERRNTGVRAAPPSPPRAGASPPVDADYMTSLARGLSVMQTLAAQKRPLTAAEISVATGISRAAVRRCLYTLVKLGFAGSQHQRHFFLCSKVLTLGRADVSTSVAAIAQPVLDRLSRVVSESCSVATLIDTEVLYVARAAVSRIMSVDLRVGSRLPAYCTSMGRVLLANLRPEQLDAYLSRVVMKRHTDRTIVSAAALKRVIETVKRRGYAITDQELEIGLRSLAVPILNESGEGVAALNVGCHAQRASIRDLQTTFLPQLRQAADEISKMM